MKCLSKFGRSLCSVSLLFSLSACQKADSSGTEPVSTTESDRDILASFVDSVVLETYQELANRSAELDTAVAQLVTAPSEASFQAARGAWVAARIPWEQSEAFLYGPVDTFGYDPAMDSWPLDHAGLDAAIAAYANIDVDTVDPSLKGFHAIEFILFGYEKAKTLAGLSSQEKSYLRALTLNHKAVTGRLLKAWKEGIAGKSAFALALKNAGESGNDFYPTTQAAIQELLEGMVGIADEVANNKIAQPFDQQDPNLVESQFSFNSLDDFQNNIRSIRFTYQGSRTGTAAPESISSRVSAQDPDLNQKVEAAIDNALGALQAIPDPFRKSIIDPASRPKVLAAQEAIRSLQEILDQNVRKLLLP